jgi:hypothetical protein
MSDWTLLATWETELDSIRDQISDIVQKIGVSDGSLKLDYMNTYKMLVDREKIAVLKVAELDADSDGTSPLVVQPIRDQRDYR